MHSFSVYMHAKHAHLRKHRIKERNKIKGIIFSGHFTRIREWNFRWCDCNPPERRFTIKANLIVRWIAKSRFCHDCMRAICRMFRERRDDNAEAARKRWRDGDVWQGSLCGERPRGSCAARTRAIASGRASERDDMMREEGESGTRRWTERVNGGWTERDELRRDRSAGSQSALDRKQYKDILWNKKIMYLCAEEL